MNTKIILVLLMACIVISCGKSKLNKPIDDPIENPGDKPDPAETTINIQEVSNTIGDNGLGKSYRQLPENVQFKQDVEIIYAYNEDMLVGKFEDPAYGAILCSPVFLLVMPRGKLAP